MDIDFEYKIGEIIKDIDIITIVNKNNKIYIKTNNSEWYEVNDDNKIEEIEQFYEQLRTLSLDDKIIVKPDQQNSKEQDLIKLKDKTDAS